MLLHPKPVEIELQDGTKKAFVLHKFPATIGREVVSQYPLSALPKLGDYKVNEAMMLKLMSYVTVPIGDTPQGLPLTSVDLVNNHVPDFEALMRLEAAMLEYNCSFFTNGKVSSFLETIAAKAQVLITSTLTGLSQR
jgi:hypothetical protein